MTRSPSSMTSGIAPKKKGGAPEGGPQGHVGMTVLEARRASNDIPATVTSISSHSPHKKLGIWLDSLVEKAKGKPTANVVSLTPELASLLLERNPANRKINQSAVERFAYEIMGGRWTFNGEPILIADTGELNDGQHRCSAVVMANKAIDVILIAGVPRDSRTTLDQGKARSAADYLSMEGHGNTMHLAAAAGYAWQYKARGQLAHGGAHKHTKSEVIEYVMANPGLRRSVDLFTNKSARGLGGVPILAFCHFAVSQKAKREDADSFFYAMTEGVNLGKGHPALYVRNRMMSLVSGRDQNAKAELIFKAWNSWRRGEKTDKIWLSGGTLPVLEA